jgi:hypothetical protein
MLERGEVVEHLFQVGEPLGSGHKNAGGRVPQYVSDLRSLEQGVDRYECSAGSRRAETRSDGLESLVQVDGDPSLPCEPERAETTCRAIDRDRELAVRELLRAKT